jgi:hypothetical protein
MIHLSGALTNSQYSPAAQEMIDAGLQTPASESPETDETLMGPCLLSEQQILDDLPLENDALLSADPLSHMPNPSVAPANPQYAAVVQEMIDAGIFQPPPQHRQPSAAPALMPQSSNAGNEMTDAELGLLLLRGQSPEMTQQPTASDLITQFQNGLRRMYGQQSQNQQLVQVGYTPNLPAAQYPMPNIQPTDGHSITSNTRINNRPS